MKAMILRDSAPVEQSPLQFEEVAVPEPGPGEILIQVEVCGVCRTDLHVVEEDLPRHARPVIPGHEAVGRVVRVGPGVAWPEPNDRVGVAWLYASCGVCQYCQSQQENLCDQPLFTGYDRDGGYAEYLVARADFVYSIPAGIRPVDAAPLLCAGIIGYRALRRSNIQRGQRLGLYGFGASAHLVMQIALYWGCEVYVCTRGESHRALASSMGAAWVGDSDSIPPRKLHGSILFAPAGELVPPALDALDKGGTLALAGIYMTPIPQMDYGRYLFQERNLRSVTANTRQDGRELMELAREAAIRPEVQEFPLEEANQALQMLKQDRINGVGALRVLERPD